MAKRTFLDFETPIADLEEKIEEIRFVQCESAVDISAEIDQLSKKSQQLTKDNYSDLTPWQITKIARHAERPYTLDYINEIFTHFVELHGDRHFADDLSIVGGLARFNGTPCMVLGQQKGRDTKERGLRNFGMSKPEGYRKALRLMKLAEKFKVPVFTFVDTPGAYPGIDAEERGQSEAIGRNIFKEQVLDEDNTLYVVEVVLANGINGMKFCPHFFPYLFRGVMNINPFKVRMVRHQGGYLAVAQVKNPFNDILFNLLNLPVFSTFLNHGFDLFLGNF